MMVSMRIKIYIRRRAWPWRINCINKFPRELPKACLSLFCAYVLFMLILSPLMLISLATMAQFLSTSLLPTLKSQVHILSHPSSFA